MPDYQIARIRPATAQLPASFHISAAPMQSARRASGGRLGWYLRIHLLCLVLYAFLGRGFAYLGARPVYIGELLLLLGLIALTCSRRLMLLCQTPIGIAMLLFFLWQITCVPPYIADYGINVARDAMVWGYALFAWIIAALISSTNLDLLLQKYRRFMPWF